MNITPQQINSLWEAIQQTRASASTPPDPADYQGPPPEVTPIPHRRRRRCYVCAAPDAVARAFDEPAFCEEHRKKR
jgi:hypothetical protein